MSLRIFIVLVLAVLSMPRMGFGQDTPILRCVEMRLDNAVAPRIGYAMKRMKLRDIDIPDADVTVQPRMAGMLGPNVTFFGRDVRHAVYGRQVSPQEFWRTARWNAKRLACAPVKQSWPTSLTRGIHWHGSFENSMGFTTYQPKILYSSRFLFKTMFTRPYGFTFGAAVAAPIARNTDALLYLDDSRPPVRRDMARFDTGPYFDNAFASWRTTPITDLHLSLTAGLLESQYGGIGGELVYRPFGYAFWAGADAWQVWRRDPESFMNFDMQGGSRMTGQVRLGYDKPDTRFTAVVSAGKYLAGDTGAQVKAIQGFDNGARLEASVTWTNREEREGFFKNSHYDPMIRLVWPLGESRRYDTSFTLRQMGRDGGQAIMRPMPIEEMTEAFSTREIIRNWTDMF